MKKQEKNNVEKSLPGKGDLSENPKLKFKDWYSSRRKKLNSGGVTGDDLAEEYGDLIDAWVRKIDVQDNESLTEYINRVKAAEKSND